MATVELNSATPRSEVLRAYQDHANYDLIGSSAAAKVFIHAARILLSTPVRRTQVGSRGGEEIELEPRIVQEQLQRAEGWYAQHAAAAADAPQFGIDPDWRC